MLLIRALHRGYKLFLSPLLVWLGGPGSGCRFEPSCSDYLLQAVETHGLWRGSWLGTKRLGRCHPWGGAGFDPVPPADTLSGAQDPILETTHRMTETKPCACHPTPRRASLLHPPSCEFPASR